MAPWFELPMSEFPRWKLEPSGYQPPLKFEGRPPNPSY